MIIVEITLFVESDNYRPTSREIRARFSFLSNYRLSEKEEKKGKEKSLRIPRYTLTRGIITFDGQEKQKRKKILLKIRYVFLIFLIFWN